MKSQLSEEHQAQFALMVKTYGVEAILKELVRYCKAQFDFIGDVRDPLRAQWRAKADAILHFKDRFVTKYGKH